MIFVSGLIFSISSSVSMPPSCGMVRSSVTTSGRKSLNCSKASSQSEAERTSSKFEEWEAARERASHDHGIIDNKQFHIRLCSGERDSKFAKLPGCKFDVKLSMELLDYFIADDVQPHSPPRVLTHLVRSGETRFENECEKILVGKLILLPGLDQPFAHRALPDAVHIKTRSIIPAGNLNPVAIRLAGDGNFHATAWVLARADTILGKFDPMHQGIAHQLKDCIFQQTAVIGGQIVIAIQLPLYSRSACHGVR